jgi:large subunit ribosomal protein L21
MQQAVMQKVVARRSGLIAPCRPAAAPFASAVARPAAASVHVSASRPVSRQAQRIVCQAAATAEAPAPAKLHPSPLSQAPPATYAVVEVGGTQMFVEPGKWYTCNRLKVEVGSKIRFGRVLALKHEGKLTVGRPYLENVSVEAEVIEELRGPKVIVYKVRRAADGHAGRPRL